MHPNTTAFNHAIATLTYRIRRLQTEIQNNSCIGLSHKSNRFGDDASCVEMNTKKAIRHPANPQIPNQIV